MKKVLEYVQLGHSESNYYIYITPLLNNPCFLYVTNTLHFDSLLSLHSKMTTIQNGLS